MIEYLNHCLPREGATLESCYDQLNLIGTIEGEEAWAVRAVHRAVGFGTVAVVAQIELDRLDSVRAR